jgi:hypothetical protein
MSLEHISPPSQPLDAIHSPPNAATRNGSFPLIALLQLASFTAMLVACVDGQRLRDVLSAQNGGVIALAVLISMVLGFVSVLAGFGWSRLGRASLVASAIGAVHGPAVLAVFAAPAPFARSLAAIAVLIISTITLRVRSS